MSAQQQQAQAKEADFKFICAECGQGYNNVRFTLGPISDPIHCHHINCMRAIRAKLLEKAETKRKEDEAGKVALPHYNVNGGGGVH